MTRRERAKLGQDMGRNMGRTLFEIYHDAEFQTQHYKFRASGPGLVALKEAQAAGKGVIIRFRSFRTVGGCSRCDQDARA